MTIERERRAWLRLGQAQGTGRPWALQAIEAMGSVERAAGADAGVLSRFMRADRARALAAKLRRARPERVLQSAADLEQTVLTPADPAWPGWAFEGLPDAPCQLFVRGHLPGASDGTVAIVGTRGASPYGLRFAGDLALELSRRGLWVVSGFARGIDAAAHGATVAAGGRTLAVLGCAVDYDYPVAHADLKEAVAGSGGVVSEHPPGVGPRRHHFPRRNRLVAALCQAVVVIEAPARSGALITARLALELGREILAVPGSVYRGAHAGCHALLRQGAAGICTGVTDVLQALGLDAMGVGEASLGRIGEGSAPEDAHEALLWRLLDDEEAVDANELCRRTGLTAEDVSVALTGLELEGRAMRVPGVGFVRS